MFVLRLKKKGTVFRASQATIDQRHNEVQALVEALFKEDVPTLVKELREERVVRDFFGYWRRDDDLARKQRPRSAKPSLAPQFRAAYSQRTFQRPTPTSKIPIPILTFLKVHIYSQRYLMLTVVQVLRDRPQRTLITNCPTTTRPMKISPGVMASAQRCPIACRRLLTALMLHHCLYPAIVGVVRDPRLSP